MRFTKETFKYFDQAKKNRKNKLWFDKNKKQYEEAVKAPISAILSEINRK